ncbi:ATP-binding protein [Glutamicibacter arilaitensis]|uniref:ATP-binding protein n=1 Tax=Glutamicibacter arilaitensis TaxID=256701 RepID=UPI001865F9DE|nr:ATP-binding protein [Glutamicibacter arilaitensis]
MSQLHTGEQLKHLVLGFTQLTQELPWVEFKVNNKDPQMIGERISALANSAALASEPYGYLVWGIEDESHRIVGTSFDPENVRIGGSELQNWLTVSLSPQVFFEFADVVVEEQCIFVLTVKAADHKPVSFKGEEYVRVGTYTKKLRQHEDYERRLWQSFDRQPFEDRSALENLDEDRVLQLIDYPSYFDLTGIPLPANKDGILEALRAEQLISKMPGTGWRITNLGAILFAKRLEDFPSLRRKALRVIQYKTKNTLEPVREQVGTRGYASGFEGLIGYINGLLPVNEMMGQALRKTTPMYPELAVRELVANALIHQDFSITGSGPLVSLFQDRLEIVNPGSPLVEVARLIDAPPRSRNEKLASLMRRMGICEERGSGWDKVAFQTEFYQLPAPLVEVREDNMQVTMFAPRELTKMESHDRVRAVYLHACLRYISHEHTNNASIRERFGIQERSKAQASRLLREAVEAGVIVPYDPTVGSRIMRYVPFWSQ